MKDDVIRKTLERYESLQRLLEPLSVRIEALQPDYSINGLLEDADPTRSLVRTAFGPVDDLRRSLQLDTVPGIAQELESTRNLGLALEDQFRLPTVLETPTLLQALETGAPATALAHYRDNSTDVRDAIEGMTTPWLNIANPARSLTGFVELQEIGHILHAAPGFEIDSAERLRPHLGDWRGSIDWPAEIFTNPLARSEFYVELGLSPALTDFPVSAFDQAAKIAGIKLPPPAHILDYDPLPELEEDDEEIGFERNNAAHDRLQRFETHVRRFIDQSMTAAAGTNWVKHRVPGQIRQDWRDKQERARDEGEPERPLIVYADFTDYETIIVRNDNWTEVFAPVFRRKTLVHESFQRLYPIRVCTMHSRLITQEDEIYLHAETQRILAAIGIKTVACPLPPEDGGTRSRGSASSR